MKYALLLLALVCGFATTVAAWTGPTAAAPAGNVAAPINTSSTSQIKDGSLGVNGLIVFGDAGVTGKLGIGNTTPSYTLDVTGNARITGNVNASGYFHISDARMKTNVATAPGLSVVEKLRGVTFDWRTGGKSAGVIAQEVEAVVPNAVATNADGIKSVDYDQFTAYLIQAIQEQQSEIDSLRHEIEILKTNQQ